ncbi:MAG: hypothetical protein FD180_473 [Planctomycetota bacterium]|nr:MAG: hypothetical protein FD180_473 [Planctomycetota bacterium]
MRVYLILALVVAACFCVLAAGEAVRRADARQSAEREAAIKAREAADADRERLEGALAVTRAREEDLRATLQRAADAQRVRDTVQAELLVSNDRLEKAYMDLAQMEKQLVDVSRAKNDLEQQLAELRDRGRIPPLFPEEPKIDGVVLGVSDKVNLVLISVGTKDKVQVGWKFTVYRGDTYVSKLVVEKVEDGWAACRELTDFRKDAIQQGDKVSTRVFD